MEKNYNPQFLEDVREAIKDLEEVSEIRNQLDKIHYEKYGNKKNILQRIGIWK